VHFVGLFLSLLLKMHGPKKKIKLTAQKAVLTLQDQTDFTQTSLLTSTIMFYSVKSCPHSHHADINGE